MSPSGILPKHLVVRIVPTLAGYPVCVVDTIVTIFTFVAFEGSVVRVEIGWPSWVIIPTRFKEGSKETPVSIDEFGSGALGNRRVNKVGLDAKFLSLFRSGPVRYEVAPSCIPGMEVPRGYALEPSESVLIRCRDAT